MADKIFADGIFVQDRDPRTPDFVLGKFSFQVDRFIAFLQQNKNQSGYVNVDLKKSNNGKKYFELNNWQPKQQQQQAPAPQPQAPVQPPQPPQQAPQQPQDAQTYVAQNPPQQGFSDFNGQF